MLRSWLRREAEGDIDALREVKVVIHSAICAPIFSWNNPSLITIMR